MTRVKAGKCRMDDEGLEGSDDLRNVEGGAHTATSVDNEVSNVVCVCADIKL